MNEHSFLHHVAFVLVGTTHTGNIGAVARAMKTMGFSDLRLVDTCRHRTEEAIARASGAADILHQASTFDTLAGAIGDCHAVVGTSARVRDKSVPVLACREVASRIASEHRARPQGQRTAVVFGQERSGLSNGQLDHCTLQLRIPCNPDFSSLNLGSAAQVVAYELSVALHEAMAGQVDAATLHVASEDALDRTPDAVPIEALAPAIASRLERPGKPGQSLVGPYDPDDPDNAPADSAAMGRLFEHLEQVMLTTGYLDPAHPGHLLRRLRHYFERNRPTGQEMSILRGVLASVQKPRRQAGS